MTDLGRRAYGWVNPGSKHSGNAGSISTGSMEPVGSEMWTDAPPEAGQQPQTLPPSTQIYTLGRLLGPAWKKHELF